MKMRWLYTLVMYITLINTPNGFAEEGHKPSSSSSKKSESKSGKEDGGEASKKKSPLKEPLYNVIAGAPETYIKLNPFTIPVIQKDAVHVYYAMTVVLETHDLSMSSKVRNYLPVISDVIFQDMYGMLALAWHENYNPDMKKTKERLLKKIRAVLLPRLGPTAIKEIYIIDVFKHV